MARTKKTSRSRWTALLKKLIARLWLERLERNLHESLLKWLEPKNLPTKTSYSCSGWNEG